MWILPASHGNLMVLICAPTEVTMLSLLVTDIIFVLKVFIASLSGNIKDMSGGSQKRGTKEVAEREVIMRPGKRVKSTK